MKRFLHPSDYPTVSKKRSVSPDSNSCHNEHESSLEFAISSSINDTHGSHDNSRSSSIGFLQYSDGLDKGEIVCYGSLLDLSLQIRENPLAFCETTPEDEKDSIVMLEPSFVDGYCWMRSYDGVSFGCLNRRLSQVLRRLKHLSGGQLEVVTLWKSLEKARGEWKQSGRSATLPLDININGPGVAPVAKSVGRLLSDVKCSLQYPRFTTVSLPYDNPQYLKLPNVSHIHILDTPKDIPGETPQDAGKEVSRLELDSVLDHIPQTMFLREVAASAQICTVLMKYQREAIDYMIARETGELPPSLSLWRLHCSPGGSFCFKHSITGAKMSEREDILGGIIADDMGLRKTLSMLAVIVNSLGRALDYAVAHTRGSTRSWQDITPSKTTLVVVPSSLLLDSWEEEIMKHLIPGAVTVHRYHGSDKAIDLSDLLRKDIVVTTYATIAADFCRGRAILNHVAWYRLVLDEAHYIRNPSRKQYRAIQSIPAHIRWCLTGTSIQNSLEDLGALVKFLRVPVLDDLVVFRRSISTPILTNTNGRFANLSTLLQAICLRRTKALLNQPEPITITTLLQLSPEEQTQYHDYAEGCRHAIDLAVSGHSAQKANQHVIQAILGMRLFCNDGEKALIRRKHTRGLPIEPQEALSFLQTSSDAKCIKCDCDIVAMYQIDDKSSGTLTICRHLLCGVCLVEFETDLDETLEAGRSRCPFCGLRADRDSFLINPSAAEKDKDNIEITEYPSKLLSVLNNVRNQSITDKCIIFSFWKTTLDITASLFDKHSISYFCIHGTIAASKRSRILTEFEESSTTRVLLITLGTGAVGLNKLKAANIVHIVEPQWNPSVENQAIGRIIRLGQEKAVTIIRYITKDTIEEAVQSRQLRKLQLARGGFGLSKEVENSDRVADIMSLMCPSVSYDKSSVNMAPPSCT